MEVSKFVRVLDELADLQVFFVNVSGGEPFLHPSIDELLNYSCERFNHLMVLTNGTAVTHAHVELLGALAHGECSLSVQVSLDSCYPSINEQTRMDTERVLRTIQSLSDAGIHVIISSVVTRHNVDDIVATILELKDLVGGFHLMDVQDVRGRTGVRQALKADGVGTAKVWKRIKLIKDEYGLALDLPTDENNVKGCAYGAPCNAAFTHLVIDPWLTVRPCDRLTDVSIGDLRWSSLSEIWTSPAVRPIIDSPVPYCRVERRTIHRKRY
jgi:MoaA/NifB/PqqE/SkfB family radical SAM enzyme